MALQSSPEANAPYNVALRKLLSNNNSLVNPDATHLAAATTLANLGLVQLREHYFVKCVNPSDNLDYEHVTDFDCANEITIAKDFDEACDDMVCEYCGRYILPVTHQKQRFRLMSVQLKPIEIMQWFEHQLQSSDYKWQRISAGVYFVITNTAIVTLLLADFIIEPSYLSLDKLRSMPTALIILRARLPNLPLNLQITQMADLFTNAKSITEIVDAAAEQGVPELLPNVSQQMLPLVPLYIPKSATPKKHLILSINNGNICIDDIVVLSKQATISNHLFKVLLKQYLQDFFAGKSSADHVPLNISQIAEGLVPYVGLITDFENHIRRPLNKMRQSIAQTLAKQLGSNINRDSVIQTLGWPGLKKQEYGYRLNPYILLFKK